MSPAVPIVFAYRVEHVSAADERLIEKLMTRLVSFKDVGIVSSELPRPHPEKRARLLAAPCIGYVMSGLLAYWFVLKLPVIRDLLTQVARVEVILMHDAAEARGIIRIAMPGIFAALRVGALFCRNSLGNDPSVLARLLGVSRDRFIRHEVAIALDRKTEAYTQTHARTLPRRGE